METADRKRGEIVGKTELAKAYVQIIPSAKGIGGMLQNEVGGETDAAGKSLGGRIGGAIKVAVIAAGIGKAISASISEGAELEQSIGGIETLFKDSAEKVKQNAANAYKTAGMSANEYMQLTTSFSASLLQSLGNDTAKAADVADIEHGGYQKRISRLCKAKLHNAGQPKTRIRRHKNGNGAAACGCGKNYRSKV